MIITVVIQVSEAVINPSVTSDMSLIRDLFYGLVRISIMFSFYTHLICAVVVVP
jgi:hypothetical protein